MMGMFGAMPIEIQDEFNPTFMRPQGMTNVNSFGGQESPVLTGGGMDVMGTLRKYSKVPTRVGGRII